MSLQPPHLIEPHPATGWKWLLGLASMLCLACAWAVAADTASVASEYQVKATFLFNFTKFTSWPSNAFSSISAPIVIGILGEDPFGNTIDDMVKGEVVSGRSLVVKRLHAGDDLRVCHLLFISRSEKERLAALFSQLRGSPVLSVSEIDGFAEKGGMVNLAIANKTVKIEINQSAAEQAGLQISAKLLKLARLVKA